MRQTLHLLIVDREGRAALTATLGSRWLLPVASCAESTRPALLVTRWCDERGISGDVVGQWLGRVAVDAVDWLVVIVAQECIVADAQLDWTPLDALRSRMAVLDYQQWSVSEIARDGSIPSVGGPFGNLTWLDDVKAWIASVTGSPPVRVTSYRAGAYEVVLSAESACGRVYFKGLAGERAVEARLTRELAALAPDAFARTLALERRPGDAVWWLTAACAGHQPRGPLLVAQALAHLQQRIRDTRSLPPLDLAAGTAWASELMGDSAHGDIIRQGCAAAMRAAVPPAWTPMDLDLTNILVDDDDAVRFIDLDDSFCGPAPLAMALLGGRWGSEVACQAYERAWSPPLANLDWRSFEIAAKVVESWRGWERLKRNVERGEVRAVLDPIAGRIRDRLATVSTGDRSPFRARRGDPAA